MSTPDADALIRRYKRQKDDKLVKFTVAKACLEPLTVANRKASTHPLVVSLWIALSCILVQVLDWWPDPRVTYLGYLRPLPVFAALVLPIIFFFDWYQRPQFEEISTRALQQIDIVDIERYYSQAPASGFWIYDFGDQFVGLVAVDASADASSNQSSPFQVAKEPDSSGQKTGSKKDKSAQNATGDTAVIRHLYVTDPYRAANAQDDLIAFTISRVFEKFNLVERIIVTPSPLMDYLARSLRKADFEPVRQGEKVGIFGWTTVTYELTRQKWETLRRDSSHSVSSYSCPPLHTAAAVNRCHSLS